MKNTGGFDLIVIGSGIAGLSTAVTAAEAGLKVAVLTKEEKPLECNTYYAQGGIVGSGNEDSPSLLAEDIHTAGDRFNFKDAVDLVSRKGPGVVKSFLIEKIGINFCRDKEGQFDRTMEAAHSVRRILHVKDKTGEAIQTGVYAYAARLENIKWFNSCIAIDLITNTHNSLDPQYKYHRTRVVGVYVYDSTEDKVITLLASAVVLATGGTGNLFLHTSNPPGATGDGMAMAYRIGAEIMNMEFIQFHPTILFHRDLKRFLISESLRGEGARLRNNKGELFMERYNPEQKDLAPRDEVSRAIFLEMEATGTNYVYLDARDINGLSLHSRFPEIAATCGELGIDIARDMIPVVPAAHYCCGGIKVSTTGAASIPGLYAVGETACTGVHGANRLASVSLLEGLFFGVSLGTRIKSELHPVSPELKRNIPHWVYPSREEEFDMVLIRQDIQSIRATMWNYAGIIRKTNRLFRALSDLNYLSHRIEKFYKQAKINRNIIELRNSVLAATLIVRAALANKQSRGCHFIE